MGTTKEEIGRWFDSGKKHGATHMIVVCDTWDYEDAPIYIMPGEDAVAKCKDIEERSKRGEGMLKVMEVYAMHLPKEEQLSEFRAKHFESPHPGGCKS
jgi:hypothetical protein